MQYPHSLRNHASSAFTGRQPVCCKKGLYLWRAAEAKVSELTESKADN
ncbi:hypothetical protein D918_05401 [Trichuris suis]|nr:hypothetical protein D918_05401 [Trichuris suis]